MFNRRLFYFTKRCKVVESWQTWPNYSGGSVKSMVNPVASCDHDNADISTNATILSSFCSSEFRKRHKAFCPIQKIKCQWSKDVNKLYKKLGYRRETAL